MTTSPSHASAAVAADMVVLTCPACGASEVADSTVLRGAPTIVCRNCGDTWPARRNRHLPRMHEARAAVETSIEAERRPVVTFSGARDAAAWQARVEREARDEPLPRASGRTGMMLAGTAAALFLAAMVAGREAAVAALPDLAGFYAAAGLPVNVLGLTIENVAATRLGGERMHIGGQVRNISGEAQAVPPLVVRVFALDGTPAGAYGFRLPEGTLAAGATAAFLLELDEPSRQASEIVIRFRRAAETTTADVEVSATTP